MTRTSVGKARAPSAREVVGAAQRADVRALERLLGRGADLEACYRNYRALHALIQEEPHGAEKSGFERESPARLACLDWLLAHGAQPDGLGGWPQLRAVLCAALSGAPRCIERLLAAGARRDLVVEAALGELARVKKLLAREPALAAQPDESGFTPLMAAVGARLALDDARAEARRLELVRRLFAAGARADVTVQSWSKEVDTAYFAVTPERLELLLEHGADATRALASAAWRAPEFVEACLRHGGRIDAAREGDRPILNELVRWGQKERALVLLHRGADPNVPDPRGWTALHQAASRGNPALLEALLAAGGDARREDAAGVSPLELARAKKKPALVALLAGAAPRKKA